MSQATDLKSFRNLLRQAVSSLRRPARELERDLRISNGGLDKLLDGRLDIRQRHILELARVLEVSPAELLELGCPDAHAGARHKVADWVGPVEPGFKKKKQAATVVPSAQEIAELIRQTVREELAAQAAKAPPTEERP